MDGIWGSLTGQGVSYTPTSLDSNAKKIIDQTVNNATAPTAEIAAKMNNNVGAAAQTTQQSDQAIKQQAAGSAQDPSMLQAIRNQYGQVASKGIQRVIDSNNSQAALTKAQWLQNAAQQAMAQQNVEMQNYENLTQAYTDSQMARAQLLSSVLSLGGTVGGMAASNSKQTGGRWKDYGTDGQNTRADNFNRNEFVA
jgi:hypothetical protein